MRRVVAISLAVGLTLSSGAATGQGQIGETGSLSTRGAPATAEGESTAAAREATSEFGLCAVTRKSQVAKKVIDLPIDQPAFAKTMRQLATDDCLAYGELRMPQLLLRGAIFEGLYKREFGRDFAVDLSKVPAFDYTSVYKLPLSGAALNTVALALVGDCVTRGDANAVRMMVASRPGSPSEDRATAAIVSRLGGCVAKGHKVRFSRSFVRAAVAEALYRLSRQAQDVASVAKVAT